MKDIAEIKTRSWWTYLAQDTAELISESIVLFKRVENWEEKFHDYSFIVFPAAKAYEGFLKKLFLDMNFITKDDYYGKHFRIGKALNPSLEPRLRGDDWVYEKLIGFCQGKELPDKLWNTWRESRNKLFHWFPDELNAVSLKEAEEKFDMIIEAIDSVFSECVLSLNERSST